MIGGLLTFFGRCILRQRYCVSVIGLDPVLAKGRGGILLLPNHPSYQDPVLLMTFLFPTLQPRILADKDNMEKPLIRPLVKTLGIKPIPDPSIHGEKCLPEVEAVLQTCVDGLKKGENYLLYPAGRIYRNRLEDLGGNSAVESILAKAEPVRVVLIRTTGLWGSSFSRGQDRQPDWGKGVFRGLKALLANGFFFGPRREVKIELFEPQDFPRNGGRRVMNRYMEAFYNREAPPALYVPYYFWEKGGPRALPEPVLEKIEGDLSEVSASTREQVLAKLSGLAGKTVIPDDASLARDLGLDSLARMDMQLWLEQTFGQQIADPEMLQTAGDCLLAACGKASSHASKPIKGPEPGWLEDGLAVEMPAGQTIPAVFIGQAARGLDRPALADLQTGQKTYRDLITAIFALKPRIEALPSGKVGIMLPASGAAVVAYLAVLFAGKVPVMVNWTAGSRNILHGLELLGVEKVISASALVSKVESMGTDLSGIRERFWFLEELGASLTRLDKLTAFLKSRLSWQSLARVKVPETAVVIFTSGSESLPKAVPLTHQNLLCNVRDLVQVFPLDPKERIIGFLPPFHSFGLTGTLLLPLCSGIPVVYHPNPTDGGVLARIVAAYRVTLLVGTPTFLSTIVRSSTVEQLASLRMAMAGAEKCPESLFEQVQRRWPAMRVLEGYGITECSPVISVNRFEDPKPGTIGKPLASVECLVVDLESGREVEMGQSGMLLVRGPSIFQGYLNYEGDSPFVEHDGKQWYRTGDLVRWEPGGILVFAGRLKRFVKLGGEMISLPTVEETLLRHFGREDDKEPPLAVEAAHPDAQPELVLFTVRPISREEANDVLGKAGLSPLHFIRQVKALEKVPLLGTGKTDYRTLKSLLG